MASKRLSQDRSYFVVKDNQLITKSRYSLTLQQQKILLYFISRIKPTDEEGTMYELDIKDFIKVCGYYDEGGAYYPLIKKDVKELADASSWIEVEKGKEVLFRWIDRAEINKQKGLLRVSFHSTVAPYLFELRERYTQYSLYDVLCLNHKYSIRLYEYLASMRYRREFEMPIEELKKHIDAEGYDKFSHLKARVIEPAILDIVNYTDLWVQYAFKKTGRSYTHIRFKIRLKTSQEMAMTHLATSSKLDPESRKRKREMWKEIEAHREQLRRDNEEWEREEAKRLEASTTQEEPETSTEDSSVFVDLLDDKPLSGQMTFDDYNYNKD